MRPPSGPSSAPASFSAAATGTRPGGPGTPPSTPGLGRQGHRISHHSVGRLLAGPLGYSLQANAKTVEGKQHPDRDAQFGYINDRVTAALAAGEPVISVDAKKKELIGEYASKGRTWRPAGNPRRVEVHDFPGEQGKAVPYGACDLGADTGWVSVGSDGDTAQFAVQTIRRWWATLGTRPTPARRSS